MDDAKNTYKVPTPQDSLESQIMDPNFPKNEREWWAAAEITRLRAEVASLTAQLQSGESFHAVAVHQRDAAWREVETLKATLTQQCKGFRADVEKLEAEVEALRADADRLDCGQIMIDTRDEFGEPKQVWHTGMNLRAAIDAAMAAQSDGGKA